MNKTILFDLDSTLLQMDQNEFIRRYFSLVHQKAGQLGYDADTFLSCFTRAAYAIVGNDGTMTNEELFWSQMKLNYPDTGRLKEEFDAFYRQEFNTISSIVRFNPLSNEIIQTLKKKGYRIILATNPLFPKICTYQRMGWAGLKPEDFSYITTYENSRYCKPNHFYYEEIFHKLSLSMEGCLMVGNDVSDDFSDLPNPLSPLLVTDYLINTKGLPITMPCFTLAELSNYIKENL